MNSESNVLRDAWNEQIEEYLDHVERVMVQTGVKRASRNSIVEMIEGQIHEMCGSRLTAESTDEDFQSLMNQLDAPESYAGDSPTADASIGASAAPVVPKKRRPRWSWLAVSSVAIPILFLVIVAIALISRQAFFAFAAATLAIPTILSPYIGWVARRNILRSDGRLVGNRVAVTGVYLSSFVAANGLFLAAGAFLGYLFLLLLVLLSVAVMNWATYHLARRLLAKKELSLVASFPEPRNGGMSPA